MSESQISGAGIGLRSQHINQVLVEKPDIAWFEILADNHLAVGGMIPAQLTAIRECYELTFHCVGMSIAGTDSLDLNYLNNIKQLAQRIEPAWISDHLCFTQFGEHQLHDLLPFPYTDESLNHVCHRVHKIQEFLKRPLLIENVSSYLQFEASSMNEAEFLSQLVKRTDCELLLDINNAYVNEVNHDLTVNDFINEIPLKSVREIHLAGYQDKGEYLIDAHNNKVSDEVWNHYTKIINMIESKATLIEWDNDIPELDVLLEEAQHAQKIMNESLRTDTLKEASA